MEGIRLLQQRTLLPQVENIKACIALGDDTQLIMQLHHTNDFLLTFTETFAEVAPNQDNDFGGLGSILAKFLDSGCLNPEVLIAACRCIKIITDHSRLATKDMIEHGILNVLVGFLTNIEFIDLAEAAIDCLASFTQGFPRKSLRSGSLPALLSHLDFFSRATQLSVLKAATSLAKSAKPEDYKGFIVPVLPDLEILLKSSSGDSGKLLEILKIYQSIANSPAIFDLLAGNREMARIFLLLCHELKDLAIWLVSFKLYAKLLLASPSGNVRDIMELSMAQLNAQVASISDQSEPTIIGVLEAILPLLYPDDSVISRLPIEVIPKNGKLDLILSPRIQVSLCIQEQKHIIPDDLTFDFYEILNAIHLYLPCSRETKTLCMIASLGVCLQGSNDVNLLEGCIENFCSTVVTRNSSTCVLALISLIILFESVPESHNTMYKFTSEPSGWRVDQLNILFKKALTKAARVLDCPYGANSISELAFDVETALFSKFKGGSKELSKWKGIIASLRELALENDPDSIPELLKTMDEVQQYICRHDHEYPMLLLELPKGSGHPLEPLMFVARPVKVSFSALIEGRQSISSRLITVDPMSSPADIFSAISEQPMSTEALLNMSVDMSTAKQPTSSVNWTEYKCSMKINDNIISGLDAEKCILSYTLHGMEKIENFASAFGPLFNNVIEIRIQHGRAEKASQEAYSPMSEDLRACFDSLDLASQTCCQEPNLLSHLNNLRLLRKLKRQLKQVLLVSAGYIPPAWHGLMQRFPFLFDFDTKVEYLRIQTAYKAETGIDPSDSIVKLARIKRGPTLEFYSMISELVQTSSMWLSDATSEQVQWKCGLYPSPIARKECFSQLGLLVARAILDNRILDLPLNEVFVGYLLGKNSPLSLRTLARVDPDMANSLKKLYELPNSALSDFAFVHPAFSQVELCPNGESKILSQANLDEYLDCILRLILETSIKEAGIAFVEAFNLILPFEAFRIFTVDEFLRQINGERNQNWVPQTILREIKADHGYTKENQQIQWLAEVFSEMDPGNKGRLIRFLTGGPQLPSGGWAKLRPALTVVCRTCDHPDQSLPTVMTCANYLKLPRYSSKDILRAKLLMAIEEGSGSFLLS
ncbi:hypothetical protein PSACC_00508 [Paramicrosporidium saccamoebae]|uniref:HECT-type E3 ubiquitin transferase n=1 Tax=Paramicrosporidium saccamoebae TaxID=1246581 RepID=A0A2H9TPI5_9FUNG|nr:hypothetical protein PSACC_00508 [Paramicrosporidium saccamoebae]